MKKQAPQIYKPTFIEEQCAVTSEVVKLNTQEQTNVEAVLPVQKLKNLENQEVNKYHLPKAKTQTIKTVTSKNLSNDDYTQLVQANKKLEEQLREL